MKQFLNKLFNLKIEKGWMWLLYLDLILPLFLFVLALAAGNSRIGLMFSRLFHAYNLYIISPIPNFKSLTGIAGLAIHIGAMAYALKRRDFKDALLCLLIAALAFLYIYFEINYQLSFMLNFIA